ncbi:hypothetical protein Tco_0469827 [Tanacetum coccineum]
MSSYTHPSIPSDYDVEDAFSSTNAPNYIPTSPDYFPVTPGNIYPDSSDDLTKDLLSSLSISPFHNDSYMKVIQAYDAISPPQVILLYQLLYLHQCLISRHFFPPERISPPKDAETPVESPIPISPSSSVRSSSPVRMPPKRTSTSAAPAMTQDAIRQLVADSIAAALEAQAANMANTDKNTGTSGTPVARKGINNHKRKFNDRRNTTTNNDNNNYSNNRNNNNYQDNHNNHNRNNDYHQQQNRRYQTCNKVGHRTKNCRSKGPATGSNLRSVFVTCHACGEKGHYKKIWLDDKLNYVEEPVEIMDREVKQLRQRSIPIIKVRWNYEFTWEREDQIRAKYPHLFSKNTPSLN